MTDTSNANDSPPWNVPLYISNQAIHTPDNLFKAHNPLGTSSSPTTISSSLSSTSPHLQTLLSSSEDAFTTWSKRSHPARRQIFLRAAQLCAEDRWKERVLNAIMQETGSSLEWGMYNWKSGCDALAYCAGAAAPLMGDSGEWWESERIPGAEVVVQRRPLGVVFSIAPWNAPFTLSVRAVAMPIMCGNTVILKSSEISPKSQALVAELLIEAGLPPGVLNSISCSPQDAPSVTAKIIAHPAVRKITFTGSDRVAKIIATEAAKYLKPCVFELGGKAPVIVMQDADLEEASKAIVFGCLTHSGQVCMSTERVIAHESIIPTLLSHIKDLVSKLKAGDVEGKVTLPPLFTKGSAENVLGLIEDAKRGGAEVVIGDGKMPLEGSVVQPHVLMGVKREMKIWAQETFGPVMILTPFNTPSTALSLANDTTYSLTSALWTTNIHTAREMVPLIHAGYVNVNGPTIHAEPKRQLEGLGGSSGYGSFGVEDFTTRRMVVMHPRGREYEMFK